MIRGTIVFMQVVPAVIAGLLWYFGGLAGQSLVVAGLVYGIISSILMPIMTKAQEMADHDS